VPFEENVGTNLGHGSRVVYIVIHCIPIPVLLRTTQSQKMIVALTLGQKEPINAVFKEISKYFQYTLEFNGFRHMKMQSKFKFSEKNHQIFQCVEEEIFEKIYHKPYSFIELLSSGRINFLNETQLTNPEAQNDEDMLLASDQAGSQVSNSVHLIDTGTLVQNL